MPYPICFVSLGPGEPELITLKGLKKLQQADIIYCPATLNKNGQSLSRAANIVKELNIEDSTIQLFTLPMSKDRTEAWKAYDRLYEKAVSARLEGKKIVIVAEGDAGFYSSIQYIYDKFKANDIEVERTAGIPAFIAAGALAGLHIVKQEEQIIVIPGILTAEELSEKIKAGYVIVIMKLSQCVDAVHECICKHPQARFHYFENVGTDKEYYTSDKKIISEKPFPYFSLMIIQ
ncbi:precorrin-2 C(20)-methyltransferase [Parabacteroides sp. AF48-14]|uniref:precorrin-2 C(20)-methyltransferase n=1 Tax=Parabacteroides sp. AF48-14 TaxID=2292052 RepID=UPI000F009C19|nr:precorrin-2 C(20)-methyltransferase [Parabacteroides sp. AF48-14]RHO73649.1 precorrin-2 C(20)-methyltransferase [Parabacteroides sp. AF48-14]